MALSERLQIVIDADATGAAGEFKKVSQAADRELGNLENLGRTAGRDLSNGIESGVGDPLNGLESDAKSSLSEVGGLGRSAGSELGANIESGIGDPFSGVAAEARSELGGLAPVGRDAGGDLSGGLLSGLNDFAGGASDAVGDAMSSLASAGPAGGAALAAGTALGALTIQGFNDALASEARLDILTARLDLDAAEAAEVGRVSARLWADAWGESRDDVNSAIDSVYSTLDDSRASERALEDLTAKAMAFAEVMRIDVSTAVSNAGVLIDSGLARDATHAFDLMTEAARRVPEGVRDELQDATQEYSQYFAGLGFSGEEAFGALVEAADGGRYAIDKTGDAVKEFRIRAVDMSAATVAAYDSIGLSAEDMTARILAGGDSARGAFVEVIEGIIALEDPAERSAAAVALMGAPFEDIAGDGAKVDEILTNLAAGSMPDVEGAADDNATAFENMATSWEVLKRSLAAGFEQQANDWLSPAAALLEVDEKGWGNVGSSILDSVKAGMNATPIGAGALYFGGLWSDLLFGGEDPEGLGFGAGRAIGQGAASGAAETDWSEFSGGIDRYRMTAEQAAVATDVLGTSIEDLAVHADLADGMIAAAKDRVDAFKNALTGFTISDDIAAAGLDSAEAMRTVSEAVKDLPDQFNASDIALNKYTESEEDAIGVLLSAGQSFRDYLGTMMEVEDSTGEITGMAANFRGELEKQMRQAGLTDDQIAVYLETLGLLPDQVETAIRVSGDVEARAQIELFRALIEDVFPEDEGYPVELSLKVGGLVSEGRAAEAAALMQAFVADLQDGVINNPIVLAVLGDTGQARLETEGYRIDEEANPLTVGVEANTQPAELGIYGLRLDEEGNPIIPPVGVDTKWAKWDMALFRAEQSKPINVPIAAVWKTPEAGGLGRWRVPSTGTRGNVGKGKGGLDGDPLTAFAMGGRIDAGQLGMVNEPSLGGELFMPDAPGFVMKASDTDRLIKGVEAIVSGGGSGPLIGNLNITETASARETALETVRRIASRKQMVGAR